MSALSDIKGMTDGLKAKLDERGLGSPSALLDTLSDPSNRKKLADELQTEARDLLEIANRLDLSRVKGVAGVFSDLLENAGVDTVKELATRNAENLHAKIQEVNDQLKLAERIPTKEQVMGWVDQAKALPGKIKY